MENAQDTQGVQPNKVLGVVIVVAAGIALLVTIGIGAMRGSDEESTPEPNYTAAITSCRDAIRPMLKDPDSAKFSNETYAENEDGIRWRVRGSVYAANSFGATTPSEYECIASWRGSEFTAEVTQLG